MNEPTPNIPEIGDAFEQANTPPLHQEQAMEIEQNDASQQYEELNHDPPEPTYDPDRVLAPSPFGNVEQDISNELGPDAQQAIREAQQKEFEAGDDFQDLRSIDEVPGAAQEYEEYLRGDDDYNDRLMDRFNHENERDHEPNR